MFGVDNNTVVRAETIIFNVKKGYLKNKNNDPCKICEGSTVVYHVILLVINVIMLV